MAKPLTLASLLLISTAMVTTAAAAQSAPADTGSAAQSVPQASPGTTAADDQAQEAPDVSIPGGDDIVVRGRAYVDPSRDTSQVLTVLSTADRNSSNTLSKSFNFIITQVFV